MGKTVPMRQTPTRPTPMHHSSGHARELLWPIVTLGIYGLPRFRPRWLYTLTALLILAAWIGVAVAAGMLYDGGELIVVPALFAIAVATFLRLIPQGPRRATHRR